MTAGDTAIGLPSGRNGDADDANAGTNETSLMLALSPDHVRPSYQRSGQWRPTARTALGNLVRTLGQPLLGMAMGWFAAPDNPHYVGDPSQACAQAGETMIAYHVKHGLRLLEQAKAGEYRPVMPYGWLIRVISRMFE